MDAKGLLSLSTELVHKISRFLSVEDVLSCSLTCHFLRCALNYNSVWKRYLPEHELTHLVSLEQHVQPAFQMQPLLSPLCTYRVHFMRKTHLLNNWRRSNVVKYRVESSNYTDGRLNALKGKGLLIYQNRYLFVGRFIDDFDSDAIEVWDLNGEPNLHSTLFIRNVCYDSFYIIGPFIAVVECFIVNVYKIDIPEGEHLISYSFSICEDNVSIGTYKRHPVNHDTRCFHWTKHWTVDDQFLVSHKFGESSIHIWDILNVCKVGSFFSPLNVFSSQLHSLSHVDNQWYLRQTMWINNSRYMVRFNFEEKSFSNKFFKYDPTPQHVAIYKSYIITFIHVDENNTGDCYDTVCTVYDFETSREVNKRRFDNVNSQCFFESTIVINGKFIILCFNWFLVIDAVSLEILDQFPCDMETSFIVHHLNLSGSVFLVTSNIHNYLEMWDVTKKRKTHLDLDSESSNILCFDEAFTKIIILEFYHICVFHFW